jgi:hypothetical protein
MVGLRFHNASPHCMLGLSVRYCYIGLNDSLCIRDLRGGARGIVALKMVALRNSRARLRDAKSMRARRVLAHNFTNGC